MPQAQYLTAGDVYALARSAGATHDEAVIMTAIAHGESGGFNVFAHNPNAGTGDNSYGLWQINMLGAMGPDRLRRYGLKSNEDLFDPRINAQVAVKMMRESGYRPWTVYTKGTYKQYLASAQQAGAALKNTWHTRPVVEGAYDYTGTPAVGDYLGGEGEVWTGGSIQNPDGTYKTLPPNATPEQIEAYIRARYPQAVGFLTIPEIRDLLIKAAQEQWTPEQLQGSMQATDWWRTNSEASRNYYALKATDPAQLKALIDQKVAEIEPMMKALGIAADPRYIAEGALAYGWTPAQIQQEMAKLLTTQSKREGLTQESEVDLTADRLMQIARNDYFIPISRQDAERWAIDIYRGAKSEESMRDYFGQIAASRFPGLAQQGFTPGEYMAPVRNIIAQTLEINPADVDFLDRRYAAVLEAEGSDGRTRPMSMAEAIKWARSQPGFRTTTGARDEAASLGESLLKTFGAV